MNEFFRNLFLACYTLVCILCATAAALCHSENGFRDFLSKQESPDKSFSLLIADGAITFSWPLSNVLGLRYQARVRSLDETLDYYVGNLITNATTVTASFSDLRGLTRGQSYKWFVGTYSSDMDTWEFSEKLQFIYDPSPVYDATQAVFGPNSATLTNPYLPGKAGDKLICSGYGTFEGYGRYLEALETEIVDSVNCLKALAKGSGNNMDPEQDPEWYYIWLAQDEAGNVWAIQAYEGQTGQYPFSGLSEAVLWMPASPVAGKIYQQMGEDYVQVQQTGVTVPELGTGLGPYPNCLKTLAKYGHVDYETVYIAHSIGVVKEEWNEGGEINGWELAEIILADEEKIRADFNGDGKREILLRNTTAGKAYVWLMDGSTISSGGSPGTIGLPYQFKGIGDFDNDGRADILWRHSTTGKVYVWLMDGTSVSSRGSPGTLSIDWEIR